MTTTHTILIEPVALGERGHRYRVTYGGGVLIVGAREPLLEACRKLQAQGIAGRLEMWRPGKAWPDMVANDIERAARLTVAETAARGPVLSLWRAYDEVAHEQGIPDARSRPKTGASDFHVGPEPPQQSPAGGPFRSAASLA